MKDNVPALFLENQLCFPLYATSRLITKIYGPYLDALGITYPQYLVMLTLWQHGEQSVKTIGDRLYLDSNTLTPLLKRLEEKELVTRIRSKTDERAVIISLSRSGNKLKKRAAGIPGKIIESFDDGPVSKTELIGFQKTLVKLLSSLNKKIQPDGQQPV